MSEEERGRVVSSASANSQLTVQGPQSKASTSAVTQGTEMGGPANVCSGSVKSVDEDNNNNNNNGGIGGGGNGRSTSGSSVSQIVPASSAELLDEPKIVKALNSDQAIEALLTRLKRSINTCDEFCKYVRKKAMLEQDREEHLKKITRSTSEVLKNNVQSLKNDSFVMNLDKIIKIEERIAVNTAAYSKELFTMHDELSSMASTFTRQRKSVKENFKRKEKEVIDSISSADKAKSKYDQLCLELERVKTTDPSKKTFTLKGSKTTSEQEEILHRKIEAADSDYRQRVSTSTGLRNVFLNTFRPSIAQQLKDLIIEIDIAMCVQMQKYATRFEDVVLQTALSITPMKGSNNQSMKTIASSIDNERDLYQYLLKYVNPAQTNKQLIPVEYRQHPSMVVGGGGPKIVKTFNSTGVNNVLPKQRVDSPFTKTTAAAAISSAAITPSIKPSDSKSLDQSSILTGPRPQSVINNDNVPLPPGTQAGFKTFGTPIGELIDFEGEMVPSVVRQCIYVVDKHGLELEGIYRTSGNIATVNSLKELIDKDPANIKLILPNPNSITDSDIYAVASLLKNYFSSLPEGLLTNAAAPQFLEYVKIAEPDIRLKRIHQVVYDLPDSSYWTLRSLILHLAKVSAKQDINLMSQRNLGIIWGPTLFPKGELNASDMTFQGRVVEELIIHANDIFEAD